MKILITTDSYYPQVNGASIFAQRLAKALKERGHDILVIAPGTSLRSGPATAAGIRIFGVSSIPVFFYKGMRIALPLDLKKAMRQVLAEFQPDVIHAQGHFTVSKAVIEYARLWHIPVVGTNHFMPENLVHYAHLPVRLEAPLRHWMWGQFREVYEGLARVTTPTARAAAYMRSNGFDSEIRVVSNGIDLGRFRPGIRDFGLRDRYMLPAGPLLLYVGRLDREKNLDLVLRALSLVPADVDVHFAIAGAGARRPELERLTGHLGLAHRVSFLGFVPDDDLPHLYSAAQCFVMAGTAELQSIATMEAMASGLPVLAADAVALPELVQHDHNGYLFEPGNVEMLSKQIRSMFSDPGLRMEMSRASVEIVKRHAVERSLDEFETFYSAAVAQTAAVVPEPKRKREHKLVPSFMR